MLASEAQIRDFCLDYLRRTLNGIIPPHEIVAEARFTSLGLDSVSSKDLLVELEDWLGIELELDMMDLYPTVADLAHFLAEWPSSLGGRN